MSVVKAKQIPIVEVKFSVEDELARFCYYFPQYTYQEAKKMPAVRIAKMLRVVDRVHAKKMHDLILVVAAPHSNKKGTIKNMLEYFKKLTE